MRNKLGICTAVWKREDVFAIWAENIKRNFPFAIVSVAYSEPHYKQIIEDHGFEAVYASNDNLSRKMNAALLPLRDRVVNVLFLGSDDIVCSDFADFASLWKGDFLGWLDCYFHDLETGRTVYWNGYEDRRKGEPIGAGKIMSSRVLDMISWHLFAGGIKKGLDGYTWQKVTKLKTQYGITISTAKLLWFGYTMMDIKSKDSITPFELVKGVDIDLKPDQV